MKIICGIEVDGLFHERFYIFIQNAIHEWDKSTLVDCYMYEIKAGPSELDENKRYVTIDWMGRYIDHLEIEMEEGVMYEGEPPVVTARRVLEELKGTGNKLVRYNEDHK